MKRVICVIITVILAGPVSAGTIRIIAEDAGNQALRIGYEVVSGSELPVGFGLDIVLSGPATFRDVLSASPHFPIYPGADIVVSPSSGEILHYGTPIADSSLFPDTLPGLDTSGATIEMGVYGNPLSVGGPPFDPRDFTGDAMIDNQDLAIFVEYWLAPPGSPVDLNGDGEVNFFDYGIFVEGRYDEQPPVVTELLLLELDGNGAATTTAAITLNSIRGGIVNSQGLMFDVILPEPVTVVVPEPATLLLLGVGGLFLRRRK